MKQVHIHAYQTSEQAGEIIKSFNLLGILPVQTVINREGHLTERPIRNIVGEIVCRLDTEGCDPIVRVITSRADLLNTLLNVSHPTDIMGRLKTRPFEVTVILPDQRRFKLDDGEGMLKNCNPEGGDWPFGWLNSDIDSLEDL